MEVKKKQKLTSSRSGVPLMAAAAETITGPDASTAVIATVGSRVFQIARNACRAASAAVLLEPKGMYLGLHYVWKWSVRKVILEVDSADAVRVVNSCSEGLVNRVTNELVKLEKFDKLDCDYFVIPPAGIVDLPQIDDMESVLG
ncbi:hypothetical protein GQ457_05G034090 [Hibiscus cannabinus]